MCKSQADGGRCATALTKDLARARADMEQTAQAERAAYRLVLAARAPGRENVTVLFDEPTATSRWVAADTARYAAQQRLVRVHAELACTRTGRAGLDRLSAQADEVGYDENDDPAVYLAQVREVRDELVLFRRALDPDADPTNRVPEVALAPRRPEWPAVEHRRTVAGETVTLAAHEGGRLVAELRYVEKPGRIHVLWAQVDDDRRGRGIATGLVQAAREGREVTTDSTTPEGAVWVESVWDNAGVLIAVEVEDEDADRVW